MFTNTSTPPQRSVTSATTASRSRATVTSNARNITFSPSQIPAAANRASEPSRAVNTSRYRGSRTNNCVSAKPSPVLAPVTSTVSPEPAPTPAPPAEPIARKLISPRLCPDNPPLLNRNFSRRSRTGEARPVACGGGCLGPGVRVISRSACVAVPLPLGRARAGCLTPAESEK
ncbi:hypothetical protein LBMAG56_34750 [Verrucomicrobiota bacterium]|nr:hypothetical protein LBMAG56_34750 [Verrucomicrobiota bacterium]